MNTAGTMQSLWKRGCFSLAIVGLIVVFGLEFRAVGQEFPSLNTAQGAAGYDELTRGPIHEAFAEQVSLEPRPGIIVPNQPPRPINELPPENRPADPNAQWIGGYWAYSDALDEAEGDFIWISGVWRIPPPRHDWVPGYWAKTDKGFQWIGGFWTPVDRDEVTYLPEPPATLEEGPTSRAPSDGHYWIPGCWYYQSANYAWRPGYWAELQPNYVWIPNYYRFTPGGYVLCGGYYDHGLASRGCLFAPVHFHTPLYTTNWYYRPKVMLDVGPLHFHLFVRPNYCHYYFGDYYDRRYAGRGYYAWHDYGTHRHAYDPLFTFNVCRYRHRGIDYHDRLKQWHHWFHKHEELRPRHTFADQRRFEERHRDRDELEVAFLASSYKDVVHRHRGRFTRADDSDRGRHNASNHLALRHSQLREQRQQAERHDHKEGDHQHKHQGALRDGRDGDGDKRLKSLDLRKFRSVNSDHKHNESRIEAVRRSAAGEKRQPPQVSVSPGNTKDLNKNRNVADVIRQRMQDAQRDSRNFRSSASNSGTSSSANNQSSLRAPTPGQNEKSKQKQPKSDRPTIPSISRQRTESTERATKPSTLESVRQRAGEKATANQATSQRSSIERLREMQRTNAIRTPTEKQKNSTEKKVQKSFRSQATNRPHTAEGTPSSRTTGQQTNNSSSSRSVGSAFGGGNSRGNSSASGNSGGRARVGSSGFQSTRKSSKEKSSRSIGTRRGRKD